MVGDVRHFEIPYVKAYLAMRFHRTAFGWKANDAGRNVTTEAPAATISVNDIDEALEQVRHGGGEVSQGKQSVGEMG
jgi:predicted enzyme related to lactoylglutathione lyase